MKKVKRVIINGGVYDLCHQGHINLLKKMRELADVLVVFVTSDMVAYKLKGKIPFQDTEKRVSNLKITGLVDEILVINTLDHTKEYKKIIDKYKNHNITYVRGDDSIDFPGRDSLISYGVEIVYLPYTNGVSSTQIRKELEVL